MPAGARDWDVLYPFQDGHVPNNYRTNWERERGKRLLADLVRLVQGAARKATTKAWYQQHAQEQMCLRASGREGSGSWYGQSGMMYGLERSNAQHDVSLMHPQLKVLGRYCLSQLEMVPRSFISRVRSASFTTGRPN